MDNSAKVDLFELADANKERWEAEYQLIKNKAGQSKSALLESFGNRIKNEWNLSINMHDRTLAEILDSGKYINVYELKDNQAEQFSWILWLKCSTPNCRRQTSTV